MNKPGVIPELSDEEEARIQAGIAADPDNPEWTEEDFKNARPFAEVFPELAEQFAAGEIEGMAFVGIDLNVVDHFKKDGPGWEKRLNSALRKAVGL